MAGDGFLGCDNGQLRTIEDREVTATHAVFIDWVTWVEVVTHCDPYVAEA